jgi:hypothetical protein
MICRKIVGDEQDRARRWRQKQGDLSTDGRVKNGGALWNTRGRGFALAADWGINDSSSKVTWDAARGAQRRAAGCSGVA